VVEGLGDSDEEAMVDGEVRCRSWHG